MKNKYLEQEEKELQSEELNELTNEEEQEEASTCELIVLEQKCNELSEANLRLMAEFDNYRKRTIREKADLLKSAGENILVNILPLVDDFERGLKALETSDNMEAAKEGVDLIYQKFILFLQQNGVKVIETENQPFDLELHEAVTTIPVQDKGLKGKIVDCVSKGYTLNDKVIRFPKVVVGE